jgi:hypothetical protein
MSYLHLDVPIDIIRFSYEISDAVPNPAIRVILPHSRVPFVIGLIIFDEGSSNFEVPNHNILRLMPALTSHSTQHPITKHPQYTVVLK